MRKASRCSFTCVFNISTVMPSSGPQSVVGRAFAKRFVILHFDTYNRKVPGVDLLNVKHNQTYGIVLRSNGKEEARVDKPADLRPVVKLMGEALAALMKGRKTSKNP